MSVRESEIKEIGHPNFRDGIQGLMGINTAPDQPPNNFNQR